MTQTPPPPADPSWSSPAGSAYPSGSAYPAGSAYPGGPELPATSRRPGTVEAAFWIYLVSAVLTFALSLLVFSPSMKQRLVDQINRDGTATQGMTAEQLVQAAQVIAVVVAAIFVAIALLFAFKMRAGRNWARVVLTVFGVLSLLSLFVGTRSGAVTDFLGPIVTLVALVLMWLPASNEYFAAATRRRAAEVARG